MTEPKASLGGSAASPVKHTPGPWMAEKIGTRTRSDWWGVYANDAEPGRKMPAECHGPDAAANARLISAAPSLADAIESMLRWWAGAGEATLNLEPARAALRAAGRIVEDGPKAPEKKP